MSDVDDDGAMETLRARSRSFGQVADLYDRTRPSYPQELLDYLLRRGATSVLDVGCGTGILGRQFLARGCGVLGVEPDHEMAAVARRHGLEVEESSFEEWEPHGRSFALLVAGQAWHWVDPERGALAAARAVAPDGVAALVWNDAVMPEDLLASLRTVYERLAPESVTATVVHRPESRLGPRAAEAQFPATGAFEPPVAETFAWRCTYQRHEWVDQLRTHSDHLLMAPNAREELLDAVGGVIDERGGSFEMAYDCHVTTFVRRASSP